MRTDELVTEVVGLLRGSVPCVDGRVYKGEKPPTIRRESYIVVNCLPISYGKRPNTSTVLNVNVHTPRLVQGTADIAELGKAVGQVMDAIPYDDGTEESAWLDIDGDTFAVESVGSPKEDGDDTYYVNIRVRAVF